MKIEDMTVTIHPDTTELEEILERIKQSIEVIGLSPLAILSSDVDVILFKSSHWLKLNDLKIQSDLLSTEIGKKCVLLNYDMEPILALKTEGKSELYHAVETLAEENKILQQERNKLQALLDFEIKNKERIHS